MFTLYSSKSSSYGGSTISNPFGNINTGALIVAGIVALILAIILLVTIVERKKAPRNGFLKWLREYLNFRSILISGIIKFVYLFSAIFLTIMSVIVMCSGQDETVLPMIGIGLAMLVFGNVGLRIMHELTMAVIVIWENTSDIRKVMVKTEEAPEEKKPKEEKEEKEVKEEKADKVDKEPVVKAEVVTEKPVVEESSVAQPVVEQPAAEQPPVEQSPAQQPPVAP